MRYIIMLFGAATAIAGIIIVINPETVFGLIRKHMASMGMHHDDSLPGRFLVLY